MSNDHDDKLRQMYGALREHDESRAPPFGRLKAHAQVKERTRKSNRYVAGAMVLATAAGVAAIVLTASGNRPPARRQVHANSPEPLRFLLASPSGELSGVPDFDSDLVAGASHRLPQGFE